MLHVAEKVKELRLGQPPGKQHQPIREVYGAFAREMPGGGWLGQLQVDWEGKEEKVGKLFLLGSLPGRQEEEEEPGSARCLALA